MSDLASLLSHYAVGALQSSTLIDKGLIHATYKVETETGPYCFQRLHSVLSNDGVAQDYERVTGYLSQKGFPAPRLLHTRTGQLLLDDEEGHRWRLTTWLEGESVSSFSNLSQVYSAAALLGRFHNTMTELEYDFQSKHPLHNTPLHLERLEKALAAHQDSVWWSEVKPLADEVMRALKPLLLPDTLPRRVVHGDPKVSNFLFDESLEAVALIDLDTCTQHSVLVDLGDAIRSWCREGSEAEEQHFRLDRFEQMLDGYASTAPSLQVEEVQRLATAGPMITLELTARFLTDVLEDSYFGWDSSQYPSRSHHNLARAKGMLFLANSMQSNMSSMKEVVKHAFGAECSDSISLR